MRIHTNTLTALDLFEAARISRTGMTYADHGSRIAKRSWDVHLTGDSRRRPNRTHYSDEYAATWDQWGVFLSVLFDRDPDALCGSGRKYAIYTDRNAFHYQTDDRFRSIGIVGPDVPGALAVQCDTDFDGTIGQVYRREQGYWPDDAHGDHTFRFTGTVGENQCTKCTAVRRWPERWAA
ncbi:MAG TPA: hypothetical protein VFT53_07270 [Candidatus Saccharimonadales bacterium]|nr:hypothetical protein [Candidatus Saccharimonadales bacterium]